MYFLLGNQRIALGEVEESVGVGGEQTVAVLEDGTLWGWGANNAGQLGDGTTTDRVSPVQIGISSDWAQVSAGGEHTVAVKTDGTLWSWGSNTYGQLGDGTTTRRNVPARVGNRTDWERVFGGQHYTIGITKQGSLFGWGRNDDGQLGDGSRNTQFAPIGIGGTGVWRVVAPGATHTLGIRIDGSLWGWGRNDYGQLGIGTLDPRLWPTRIGTSSEWANVGTGTGYSIGVQTDGSLWFWGEDELLAVGTPTPTVPPTATVPPRASATPTPLPSPSPTSPPVLIVDTDLPTPKLEIISEGAISGEARFACTVPPSQRRSMMRSVGTIVSVSSAGRSVERVVAPNSKGILEFERQVDADEGEYARLSASCYLQVGNKRSRSSRPVRVDASPYPSAERDRSLGTPRLNLISTNTRTGNTKVQCKAPSNVPVGRVTFILMVTSTTSSGEKEEVLVTKDDEGDFSFVREEDEQRDQYVAVTMSCYMSRGNKRSEFSNKVRRGAISIGGGGP